MNYWVKFHFIDKDGEGKFQFVPINRIAKQQLPKNILFITIVDDKQETKWIIGIANRINIEEKWDLKVKKCVLVTGKEYLTKIFCKDAQIYITSMYIAFRMISLINHHSNESLEELNARMKDYASHNSNTVYVE